MDNGAVRTRAWIAAFLAAAVLVPWAATQTTALQHPTKAPAEDKRVDLNHASLPEIEKIPGMTTTWAARIVRFRPYRTKLDLLERGVVTSQVYDRIKDFVIVHRDPAASR